MKHRTLLLIKEDQKGIDNIKQQLKDKVPHHTLHVTNNEVDALTLLTIDNIHADFILLDINTPKMNGIEFLRIIKSYHSFKSIKVFILTESEEAYTKIATQNMGVRAYIVKPLNFTDKNSPGAQLLLADLLV
ncbi:MAG: response regulator [Bacteroidia bacterium]|nr:response regulator [Bacteroidia bacterium]